MSHKPLPLRKLTAKEHHKLWWAMNGHIVNAMRRESRAEARKEKELAKDAKFKVKPLPKLHKPIA